MQCFVRGPIPPSFRPFLLHDWGGGGPCFGAEVAAMVGGYLVEQARLAGCLPFIVCTNNVNLALEQSESGDDPLATGTVYAYTQAMLSGRVGAGCSLLPPSYRSS